MRTRARKPDSSQIALLVETNDEIQYTQTEQGDRIMVTQPISKDEWISKLLEIRSLGWVPNARPGNHGGVGNTLEDLLGIKENNLPIPNAAEWELKCQAAGSTSLTTVFHMEPSPTTFRFVPSILLPLYGWRHVEAGVKYPETEMSFRQTIGTKARSDRGFCVFVDREQRKIVISFDAKSVDPRHKDWLSSVERRVGLGELSPQPYWGFDDLYHKAGVKLTNVFYVEAQTKREGTTQYFNYSDIYMLKRFDLDGFLLLLEQGVAFVDFDARTGHNHGTKFRIPRNKFTTVYESVERL